MDILFDILLDTVFELPLEMLESRLSAFASSRHKKKLQKNADREKAICEKEKETYLQDV